MSEAKFHYSLSCPNGHGIPIPRPNLLEIHPTHMGMTTGEKKVIVACPECGLVSVYLESSVQMNLSPIPDPFDADRFRLVVLEVECGHEGCETPRTVHTVLENDKGTWKQKIVPKDWTFSADCLCENGHPLAPRWEDNRFAWERRRLLF